MTKTSWIPYISLMLFLISSGRSGGDGGTCSLVLLLFGSCGFSLFLLTRVGVRLARLFNSFPSKMKRSFLIALVIGTFPSIRVSVFDKLTGVSPLVLVLGLGEAKCRVLGFLGVFSIVKNSDLEPLLKSP